MTIAEDMTFLLLKFGTFDNALLAWELKEFVPTPQQRNIIIVNSSYRATYMPDGTFGSCAGGGFCDDD